ncbi:MAG: hypothetical protein GF383_02620 [Candidatus Lokiarchaeota archaeon]|nr:hypothetical protein [Candidatus Lokiarchaeota archaeon]MBD3338326.1 hypothetical protein [Candidatus Lokiarchaeota archaeon]
MSYTVKELKEFIKSNPPIPNNYSGYCFGCVNPSGLELEFWRLEESLFTFYNIPPKFSGFQGLGHGGIIATLLDEVSAWTISVNLNRLGLTQNFAVNYIKPVYINTDIVVEGKIGANDDTHVIVHAHIKDMSNKILVESNSTWSLPDKKSLARLFHIRLEDVEEVYRSFFGPIKKYFAKI